MLKTAQEKVAAVGTALTLLAGNAMAAVPAEVTTGLTDGMADGKTIAYGILGLSIVIGIIVMIRRKV